MTDHIKQMAIEAGFGIGHSEAAATLFEKFAQLIAEDCARIGDDHENEWLEQKFYSHRHAASEVSRAIRARYSIT